MEKNLSKTDQPAAVEKLFQDWINDLSRVLPEEGFLDPVKLKELAEAWLRIGGEIDLFEREMYLLPGARGSALVYGVNSELSISLYSLRKRAKDILCYACKERQINHDELEGYYLLLTGDLGGSAGLSDPHAPTLWTGYVLKCQTIVAGLVRRLELEIEAERQSALSHGRPPTGKDGNGQPKKDRSLTPRIEKAYQEWKQISGIYPKHSDKEIHAELKNRKVEKLPKLETWIKYVQRGRKFHGEQKNHPRRGRSGRSIVSTLMI